MNFRWFIYLAVVILGLGAGCTYESEQTAVPQSAEGAVEKEESRAKTVTSEVLQEEAENASAASVPELTPAEFERATGMYFDRCAGCHGVLRKGATGPALTPEELQERTDAGLATIIANGTSGGMPGWGDVLGEDGVSLLVRFLRSQPPTPPEMSLEDMRESWKLIVEPGKRPTTPEHGRNWQNFFSVTLRDAGKVAIIDGDTKEVVSTVDTGYAVHISRMSATGRYVYTIGRDGKAVMIDLWMEKPDKVAEVKACYDARSIEVSKYRGEEGDFYDRYVIVGCYWPPHFVILNGSTLEPIKVVSTRGYTYDTGEYHPEPRVASIVASRYRPRWIVSVKETGQIWLVDYSDVRNPTVKMIEAERFLHDGGWDATGRYFLVAANKRNSIVVLDAREEKVVARVETGRVPHPGRGANWVDPEYGPVWATVHLGEGLMALIGTDPEEYPEYAWKVVRRIELPSSGSLFIKTHPDSPWVWVDFPLSKNETMQRSVCVVSKEEASIYRCWQVADYGRAVHIEYSMDGREVWVSVWGRMNEEGREGEIVVYDDRTLQEKTRIKGLVTPTGKFNVYNTAMDVY